jgi:hypothetical protein
MELIKTFVGKIFSKNFKKNVGTPWKTSIKQSFRWQMFPFATQNNIFCTLFCY